MRGYSFKIVHMISDDEFLGMALDRRGNESACYAWSKGAGFFVYIIGNGHIQRLGTLKRPEVDTLRAAMV